MGTKYRPRGKALLHEFKPGPNMHPGSELHGSLAGRPVIVMGQAYSLNYVKLDKLAPFKTISCNRCLRADSHVKKPPDYYVCVDRDPYAQEVENVRNFKGTRVLSKMLFDPNNLHPKKKIRTHWAECQPYPDFEWYGFRPVSSSRPRYQGRHVYTTWPDPEATLRNGIIPSFNPDLDMLIPGAANVAYSMFQIAVALGASVIGIVGVDLSWESGKKSHSFGDGNGKAQGAFSLSPRTTLPFFRAGLAACHERGIEVFNLSPRGILSPTIPALTEVEFHKRFAKFADGDLLYPRELKHPTGVQFGGVEPKQRRHNRYKPSPPSDGSGISSAGRSDRARGGTRAAEIRRNKAANLARSRRKGAPKTGGD